MNKFLLTIGTLFLLVVAVNAQKGIVINESFEGTFPPTDWANFHEGGGTEEWEQSDYWPVTGTYCARAGWD